MALGAVGNFPRAATFGAEGACGSCACANARWDNRMHIDRVQANRFLAVLGFALSFLFLLAIVALAFTEVSGPHEPPPPIAAR